MQAWVRTQITGRRLQRSVGAPTRPARAPAATGTCQSSKLAERRPAGRPTTAAAPRPLPQRPRRPQLPSMASMMASQRRASASANGEQAGAGAEVLHRQAFLQALMAAAFMKEAECKQLFRSITGSRGQDGGRGEAGSTAAGNSWEQLGGHFAAPPCARHARPCAPPPRRGRVHPGPPGPQRAAELCAVQDQDREEPGACAARGAHASVCTLPVRSPLHDGRLPARCRRSMA